MTNIDRILKKGKVVRNHLLQMLSEKSYACKVISNLLSSYADIALEHHESIHLLISRKLNGSSFALVRPLFETFYRAHWVYGCASQEEVEEICNNDSFQFPKMSNMVQSIDEKYASDTFFSSIKDNSWSSMCSYTHTGLLPMGRRFTGNTIRPNYSDGEILEVLNSTNMVILFITRLFFIAINHISEVEETEKIILEL